MKKVSANNSVLIFVIVILLGCSKNLIAQNELKLWYVKPATVWNEALPIYEYDVQTKTGEIILVSIKQK